MPCTGTRSKAYPTRNRGLYSHQKCNIMTQFGKGTDKQETSSAGDLETVLAHAQEAYTLIKKAAANGNTGKKEDRAELIGALAKTTKGVVGFAMEQHKKHAAKKKEKAAMQRVDCNIPFERAVRAESCAPDVPTFQARFQLRGNLKTIVIDTAARFTMIDRRYLQIVAPDARIEPLDEPIISHADGCRITLTAKALFMLEIAGEAASIRLPCSAYVADGLRTQRLLVSGDMLALYGIDLLLSTMQMRLNGDDGELVPLGWGEQVTDLCSNTN